MLDAKLPSLREKLSDQATVEVKVVEPEEVKVKVSKKKKAE